MGFATRLYKLSLTSEDSFIHRVYQYILPVYLYLSEAATRMEVPGKDIRIRCRTKQVSKPVSGYVPKPATVDDDTFPFVWPVAAATARSAHALHVLISSKHNCPPL